MSYSRKNLRANFAANDDRHAATFRIANAAFKQAEYTEDAHGNRIRVWADGSFDYVTEADVRAWLRGNRVIEDLVTGLEYVRERYIRTMIKEGYLRHDPRHGFYWVTAKAAERFKLPKMMGCDFPPTERAGDR